MSSEIFQSTILGIVQGLGEFLPISSTAHLILAPYFFGWEDPGLSFDVALHIGTLIAVLFYFWRDWVQIISNASFPHPALRATLSRRERGLGGEGNLLWFLIIATIPGVLVGYFLEEKAGTIFRNPIIVALTLAAFGLVLYLTDKYIQHKKNIGEVSFKDSIIVGLSQAIAIIPGVSRSGATITAGLLTGLDRVSAARFSFLLSTPIIFGAAVMEFNHLFQEGFDARVITGIIASAISGYLAIKYLLKFVEKTSYKIFFWYRLVLALLIILVYFLK